MKIIKNNEKIILYAMLLMVLKVFLALSGAILILMKPIASYLILSLACALGFIVVFYLFVKVKTFEYENSMQFIAIKQSYFWRLTRNIPPIEFPNEKLAGFGVNKMFFNISLMLLIKSEGQKTKKIYCKITGLSKSQISELKLSLQNAKEYDEN